MRILSGVQPSGRLHIGNWFGAIRQFVKLQNDGHDCFYFLANYHALTSSQDKAFLAESTMHLATGMISLGIDPEKSTLFVQSDVPQVAELTWFLNCVCPMGLLERATSFKDKVQRGIQANVGLFDYPVLQAADILIYDSNVVPVGADQKQHLEITRDLAGKLNLAWGDNLLVVPEPYIVESTAVVPGIDGQKMSKSYDNTIEIFATDKATTKRCRQIVTDSTPLEDPKDPATCNVFSLIKLFASPEELAEIEAAYRAGGYGYGHAKNRLGELINAEFAQARERYEQLRSRPDDVKDMLAEGGRKARKVADATMARIREASGILTSY
ncbi:MAG: tryptophan--tRNA ligase [Myxococcota bacterium]|jgi:tryptophanyl-tRNA synthetase|nr:tryptophan--tRNA ligase [Myxococcota bacterium]MBP8972088.1 tryptophan--tRNA ligase [Myxococcota bacterium]HHW96556.1 tryptophan--tRNA ligase [Oligoflexales bacterium]HQC45821.1 tryptophan--tRNA ligase [Myxococcota bacterium]HQL57274.1 tryptophan--tRNA ligase [Myxococcota bacterium]